MPVLKNYSLYIILAFLVVVGLLAEPYSSQWLRFDRGLIDHWELWRLLTAHFVHLSLIHALGNLVGVLMVGYIAGQFLNNRQGVLLFFWCALWVGGGLYLYAGYLQRYVGLSGVLHGLLIVAPFVSGYYSRKVAWAFLIVIAGKVIWEQTPWYNDMSMSSLIGGRVEVNSHLFGAIAGILYLIGLYRLRPDLIRN